MTSSFRADRLEDAFHTYGIYFDENIKWDNEKMIKRLGDRFIELEPEKYSWGARYVQSLSTPMLCRHLKDDLKGMKFNPVESDDYVAETKENGFRTLMCYSPESGFEFFSRRESVANYLNSNFTDKFLFINNGLITEPKDYIGKFPLRFVLDGELLIESSDKDLDLSGLSIEDYIQGVLGSSPERARNFQKDGHLLKMIVFDVLYFEKNPSKETEWEPKYCYEERELNEDSIEWVEKHFSDYLRSAGFSNGSGRAKKLYQYLLSLKDSNKFDVRRFPFIKRRELRTKLVSFLKGKGLPFVEVKGEDVYKVAFTETVLSEGGEGCFKSSCRVNMPDGTLKPIAKIKEGDYVLSYNVEKGELESRKVLRKINNGLKSVNNWISVSHGALQGNEVPSKQNRFHRIICTKNHNFFDGFNYTPIEDIEYCYELSKEIDDYRYQALLGWLLSDGYLDKNGVISLSQKESSPYWKFTVDMFRPFTTNGCVKTCISEKGSRIGRLCINKEYCIPFWNFNEDRISYINQMNEIALAYLIMGDGSRDKNSIVISTCSLTEEEVNAVINRITVLFGDIKYSLVKDKRVKSGSGLSIRLWKESFDKIKNKIISFIHPSQRYKTGESDVIFKEPPIVKSSIKKVPVFKKSMTEYEYKAHCIGAWDLEIEGNHNFFVENVLVHNSIIKNKYAPYISGMRSSRSHRAAMKVKQSIESMLTSSDEVKDFDVFITGANPPKSDRITDMIGSLSCSVYIKDENGDIREHEIANVSGISHEWKRKLAQVNSETGIIELNPEYKDKVISINGLALTGNNLKFQHATLQHKGELEFKAKNPSECTYDESFLRDMVLTRGK